MLVGTYTDDEWGDVLLMRYARGHRHPTVSWGTDPVPVGTSQRTWKRTHEQRDALVTNGTL